jgi:hypothetical protein
MSPARPTRRRLLTLPVAAAVATGCSPGGTPRSRQRSDAGTIPVDSTEAAIFDLSFTVESRDRPFAITAPGFVLAERAGAQAHTDLVRKDHEPLPAPFVAVEFDIDVGPGGVAAAGLGTVEDPTHARRDTILGCYDPSRREATVEVHREGQRHVLARADAQLPASGSRLAVAICENQVTVLAGADRLERGRAEAWRVLVTERNAVRDLVDLRRPDTLSAQRLVWGARPASGEVRCSNVRAGLFGMTGMRDPHLVQHADGRPYVVDGKAYFTATCAGPGFFQQAHWGVFRLDLADPTRLEQVAQLYSFRDGLLLGDHAGQLVRDDEHGRWIVATSSWGDFSFRGVHVRHSETSADLLSGVHVLQTVPTNLPTTLSSWDPGMTRIGGRWHVSFVESQSQDPFDFHPALAAGPPGTDWDERLELVGAADGLHQCEGPILAHVGGTWRLLASDGDARRYPVFDLSMTHTGFLDAPYGTNIPHPQLVPLDDGEHLLVTFDGTQFEEERMGYGGHGDVLIMRSAPQAAGR